MKLEGGYESWSAGPITYTVGRPGEGSALLFPAHPRKLDLAWEVTLKNITVVRKQWTTGREVGIDPFLTPFPNSRHQRPSSAGEEGEGNGGGTGGRRAGSEGAPNRGGGICIDDRTGSQACPSPRSRPRRLLSSGPGACCQSSTFPSPWATTGLGAPLPLSTVLSRIPCYSPPHAPFPPHFEDCW